MSSLIDAYRRNRADILGTIASLEAEGDIIQTEMSKLEQRYETNLKARTAMRELVRNYDMEIAKG